MNTTVYPFEFKKYRTKADRLTCPGCGRAHSLVPYVDVATGEDLPGRFGRCNRADSCGYHEKPSTKDLNRTDQEWEQILKQLSERPVKPEIIVDMPSDLLLDTLAWNDENTLYTYLIKLLPADVVKELFNRYLIANHKVWPGAVVFWFVNVNGAIRAGQVKQFDQTGHTVKSEDKSGRIKPRTIWIHSLITEPLEWLQPYLDQKLRCDCLFGEHLLSKYPYKPVALFESPKTAILAAAHFPDFLCLAVGALDYLSYNRLKVLKGRKVILYPDLSKDGKTFASWSEKADRFKSITDFKVSRILEDIATDEDRIKGLDMADYLEKLPYLKTDDPNNQSVKEQLIDGVAKRYIVVNAGVTKSDTPTETDRWVNAPKSSFNNFVERNQGVNNLTPYTGKSEESQSYKKEVLIPKSEISTSEPFNGSEYLRWMKNLAPLKPGESIRIDSCQYPVYNIQFFIQGRLKAIESWNNSTRGQGDGPLFKTQLIELRTILNNRQIS